MTKTLTVFAALIAISTFGCKKEEKKEGGETANPCASKNPCADKTAKNPCNPCAGKATKNPCNPCAGKNPCNPCGDAKPDPMAHLPKDKNVDMVIAKVGHTKAQPTDPVHVVFEKVTVKESKIKNLKDLSGSTATIEIDVMAPNSGIAKRDAHLKKDFFKGVAVVKIGKVKKDGDGYKAEADISLNGVSLKWPVTFKVVEQKDDWVRVQGMHKLKRSDFKVGTDIEGPADDVDLMLQVTLKKG